MSSVVPVQLPAGTTRLPPLGGRLLLAYRLAWFALAAAALATLAWSWAWPAATGIWLLRTGKAIVLIAVSAILLRRRGRDPVAALLALSFLLWTISSSVDFLASSASADHHGPHPLPVLRARAAAVPERKMAPTWIRPVGIAIMAAFLLGIAEASGLAPTRLFLPIAIGCVLATLALLVMRYRSLDPGTQKQQLKWVILGLVSGISFILSARVGALITQGMAVPLVGAILLEGLFQLGIVVVALGFLTSMLRYRLYDAEAAISRSAVYAALTLTLVGTFAASEALIELLGQRYFGMAIGNVSGAVAAAIAAMMLTPLHGRISGWAEQRFQHDLVTLKAELPDLLAVLSASSSVKQIGAAVLPRIEQAVQASRIALLVDGRLVATQGINLASARRMLRQWKPPADIGRLERDDEAAFPLRVALHCPLGSVRGWLLLGPRPDGSFYGRDDLGALSEIAPPLQRSLFAVAERESAERKRQRSDAKSKALVKELADRIDRLERRNVRAAISAFG